MANLRNYFIETGRLTSDPVSRQIGNGTRVEFTLAIDAGYKGKDGKNVTDFIRFYSWNKTGELIAKYCKKGRMIQVGGSVKSGSYEKDGEKHYTQDLVVDSVSFLPIGNGSNNGTSTGSTASAEPAADSVDAIDLDEIGSFDID